MELHPVAELVPSQPQQIGRATLVPSGLFGPVIITTPVEVTIEKVPSALSSSDSLAKRFDTPPAAARPWVFWWWMDHVSHESITRDLEALKAKGIGGMILYACDGSILPEDIFGPRKMYWTPEWVERVNHAGVKKQSIN